MQKIAPKKLVHQGIVFFLNILSTAKKATPSSTGNYKVR
jgi:hypothetical protein